MLGKGGISNSKPLKGVDFRRKFTLPFWSFFLSLFVNGKERRTKVPPNWPLQEKGEASENTEGEEKTFFLNFNGVVYSGGGHVMGPTDV